jgi:hypothetical protein
MDHGDECDCENADFVQVVIDLPLPILEEVGKAARERAISSNVFMASAIMAALVRIGKLKVEQVGDPDEDEKPPRPN